MSCIVEYLIIIIEYMITCLHINTMYIDEWNGVAIYQDERMKNHDIYTSQCMGKNYNKSLQCFSLKVVAICASLTGCAMVRDPQL